MVKWCILQSPRKAVLYQIFIKKIQFRQHAALSKVISKNKQDD